MFLTPDDVETITGYKRFAAQKRWLDQRCYAYEVNAIGRPIVLIAELNRHAMGGKSPANDQPDFTFMQKIA